MLPIRYPLISVSIIRKSIRFSNYGILGIVPTVKQRQIMPFIVESTITWTSWMGEVTNLASGGGGWFAEQLSTYFRALL